MPLVQLEEELRDLSRMADEAGAPALAYAINMAREEAKYLLEQRKTSPEDPRAKRD